MGYLMDSVIGLVIVITVVYGIGYVVNGLIKIDEKQKLPELMVIGVIILLHYVVSYEFYCMSNTRNLIDILSDLIVWEFGILSSSFVATLLFFDVRIDEEDFSILSSAIYFILLLASVTFVSGMCIIKILF